MIQNKLFKKYKLEKINNEYIVTILLETKDFEFSSENLYYSKSDNDESDVNIIKFVRNNFKDIKITAIKLMLGSILIGTITFGTNQVGIASTNIPTSYVVKSGDSLWKISNYYGIGIDEIKELNNISTDNLYIGQELILTRNNIVIKTEYEYYTVQSGDSLWKIATKLGTTIDSIKSLNSISGDAIFTGQKIKVKEVKIQGIIYIVNSGDTIWKIANNNNSTISAIMDINGLEGDNLNIGQELFIPIIEKADPTSPIVEIPQTIYNWPDITYIVEPGDTVSFVAKKFGTTISKILEYNYMEIDEWLNSGDKIAISDYAPRKYTVSPGEAVSVLSVGKLVDWTNEGQYILKRNTEFVIYDIYSDTQFNVKMLAGYNHADIEPLTSTDTNIIKSIFGTWEWKPRPVVIFIDGMNIAGSLSGMPHGVDLLPNNGVIGHFDLYLHNSTSHSTTTSPAYIQQHRDGVNIASGLR